MLTTTRLLLRPHTVTDLEAVFQLAMDTSVTQYIRGMPTTRQEAWFRLLRYAGHWSLLGFGMFAVIERSTGHFLGEVGLADFKRDLGEHFDCSPEAAWLFKEEAHGKGFAYEAITAALHWFDQQRPATRTVCLIDPENTASTRLAGKLGYSPFGSAVYREKLVTLFERIPYE